MIKSRITFAALLLPGLVFVSSQGYAQVILDGSLGSGSFGDLVAPDPGDASITYDITQDLGATVGNNLFHSFDMFDVNASEIARFSGAAPIQNIVSRITGGSQSGIDGTIRSSIVAADVWLINPSGFVFGANAVLDTTGSFHVGAADSILFVDGRFPADISNPANTMLSSAAPAAFGFVNTPTARVDLNSATLNVAPGETISLVGAELLLDSSRITAPGGQINLVSVGAVDAVTGGTVAPTAGAIQISGITYSGGERVSMTGNSVLDVSAAGSGSVFIRGGQFLMGADPADDEQILATSSDSAGGVVDIDVSGQMNVRGEIRTDTSGAGSAADISINAGSFLMTNAQDGGSTSVLSTASSSTGSAGSISISTDGSIDLASGRIDTPTSAEGTAGDLSLLTSVGGINLDNVVLDSGGSGVGNAGNQTIDAGGDLITTTDTNLLANAVGAANAGQVSMSADNIFFNGTIDTSTGGSGTGGGITLSAVDSLVIESGFITAVTTASGAAGDITLNASTIEIRPPLDTNIASISADTSGSGRGGDIRITADRLSITGNTISANTSSSGNGGNIVIQINGLPNEIGLELLDASIQASASGSAAGDAGTITIFGFDLNDPAEVIDIVLSQNSRIVANTTTEASGSAGGVEIQTTGAVRVFGDSLIGSFSEEATGGPVFICPPGPPCGPPVPIGGLPGTVTIVAGSLSLGLDEFGNQDGVGRILASTESEGTAGRSVGLVTINIAGEIEISGPGSQISTTTSGLDNAAGIQITGGNLTLSDGGVITASTEGGGNAGDIDIDIVDTLLVDGTSSIEGTSSSGATGAAGNINIGGAATVVINGVVSTSTNGSGVGGTISFDNIADTTISGQLLSSTTGTGSARSISLTNLDNLTIAAGGTIESRSIGADSGAAGNVTINDVATVQVGGVVSTNTTGSGAGGIISFDNIGNLTVDGGTISTDTAYVDPDADPSTDPDAGIGGSITTTNVNQLTITGGGQVIANTSGSAKGGSITLGANTILVSNGGIVAANTSDDGDGGVVRVNATDVVVSNGGRISAVASADGDGGDIFVDAADLLVDSGGQILADTSGIGTNAGRGGSISIGDQAAVANVTISGADSSISANAFADGMGGSVSVNADLVTVTNLGRLEANTIGLGEGGDVIVSATDIVVSDDGQISAVAFADGDGGDIIVIAIDLLVDTGGEIVADTLGDGIGGSVDVIATNVDVLGNGSITAGAFSTGDGGNVNIAADSVNVTGIIGAGTTGVGNGGIVDVTATILDVSGGGQIVADTSGGGGGGDIFITADRLSMTDGTISANTNGAGIGGDIAIQINGLPGEIGLELVDASIQASSLGIDSGDAGNITITAADPNDAAELIDIQLSQNSRIVTNTTSASLGSAGAVVIQATGAVRVFGDSEIGSFSEEFVPPPCPPGPPCTAPTFIIIAGGLPGSVTISADALSLGLDESGNQAGPGRILASTDSDGDGRSAGLITINVADEIRISGPGSEINTTTSGLDTAAGIEITSRILTLSDGGTISASTTGEGGGGSIGITADTIFLQDGGEVSVTASGSGAAGVITMTAAEQLRVTTDSSITASSVNSGGGEINIYVDDFIFLSESNISASSGGNQSGGNITIGDAFDPQLTPLFFIIVDSNIIAEGGSNSAAGNIDLFADNLFIDEKSRIEATNELNINTNIADMTATIVVVDAPYLNVLHLLEDRCAATAIQDRSSFVIEGIHGFQSAPDGYVPSSISTSGDVESTTHLQGTGTSEIDMAALAALAEAVGC